ncbi:hypothetical protein RJ641_024248, partial [Dillenia turbinata]
IDNNCCRDEAPKEENVEFKWGRKGGVGAKNKQVQFCESFTYDGVDYSLFDCVYLWGANETKPYVGKLVKIWEKPNNEKWIKTVWFFCDEDIKYWLKDDLPLKNEIFLASGEGIGLSNINHLESISAKCNVVCTSKDKRNPRPSESELEMADYIFYRTFDVGSCKISENFPETINGLKGAQKVLNESINWGLTEFFSLWWYCYRVAALASLRKDQNYSIPWKVEAKDKKYSIHPKVEESRSMKTEKLGLFDKPVDGATKYAISSGGGSSLVKESRKAEYHLLKRKMPSKPSTVDDTKEIKSGQSSSAKFQDNAEGKLYENVSQMLRGEDQSMKKQTCLMSDVSTSKLVQGSNIKMLGKSSSCLEARKKWFDQLPWENRLQQARGKETLVLLQNLDPSYTSSEIEDLIWHALKEKVEAKMIPYSTFKSPYFGQAFVIFKSNNAAESAFSKLRQKCLMVDGRPVVASIGDSRGTENQSKFVGHLVIDKLKYQSKCEEMRNAKCTAHHCQGNTIEFEMALEWCLLNARSDACWKALHESQAKEIEACKSNLIRGPKREDMVFILLMPFGSVVG